MVEGVLSPGSKTHLHFLNSWISLIFLLKKKKNISPKSSELVPGREIQEKDENIKRVTRYSHHSYLGFSVY